MTCSACGQRMSFGTCDGRAFQDCGCGIQPVARRGAVSLAPARRLIGARERESYGTRLPAEDVAAIRQAFNAGDANIPQLARQYGVNYTTIARIVKGESHNSAVALGTFGP